MDGNRDFTVAVDVRMARDSGIGTYLRSVLPRLVALRPDTFFYLIGDAAYLSSLPWAKSGNIGIIDCRVPIYSIAEQMHVPSKVPAGVDLLWVPHFNVPLSYRGRLLVTVHDLFHLAMPKLVGGAAQTAVCQAFLSSGKAQVGGDSLRLRVYEIGVRALAGRASVQDARHPSGRRQPMVRFAEAFAPASEPVHSICRECQTAQKPYGASVCVLPGK